jgi:transposase
MKTIDFRSLPPAGQERLRRKAVDAVLNGMTIVEAARVFGVTRQAVGSWMERYEIAGARALKAQPRGRPRGTGRLLPWQAAQTARAVVDRCPNQLKLPFWLWTREAVGELIERRYHVRLSVWTVGRMLRRWGFTPQKPLRRAYEQDPAAVKRWLEDRYPAIRRQAKAEKAEIYWGDEMGMRSDHQTGTSYGRQGKTPTIPGTGKRFGCNMLSAITNRGHLLFLVFKERFNSAVFVSFLRRLVRQVGRKAFLIVDGHPAHRSALVQRWVAGQSARLRVFYSASYVRAAHEFDTTRKAAWVADSLVERPIRGVELREPKPLDEVHAEEQREENCGHGGERAGVGGAARSSLDGG